MKDIFSKRINNKSDIIKKIEKYQYVSFDVFDTLIKRNIPTPGKLFEMVEQEGIKEYGKVFLKFSEKRIAAESSARKKNKYQEVTLDEIYLEFKSFSHQDVLNWAKNKELELEKKLCVRNIDFFNIYNYCLKNNKTIIITTDMYLSKDIISEILIKCGIHKWKYLFVSSEYRLTKSTGSMYENIIKTLKINSNELIHIGDNKNSDYNQARHCGIDAILIAKNKNFMVYPKTETRCLSDECAKSFINNFLPVIKPAHRLGFECFGPLLFGFSMWLKKELYNNGISDAYFLSRDGYILKKAFDIVNEDEKIHSHYFYTSRRSLRVPALSMGLTYEEYLNRNFWNQEVTAKIFAETMGINTEDKMKEILQGIDEDYCVSKKCLESDAILKELYYKILKSSLLDAEREKRALDRYIQQEGMGEHKGAIIDIGWHGNMQLNLMDILKREKKNAILHGYYLGIIPYDNHKEQVLMNGFLFDKGKNEHIFCKESEFNALFEEIFMAPHGSVHSYFIDDDQKVKIRFSKNEQTDQKSIELLKNYQEGGLQFVKLFYKYKDLVTLSEDFCMNGIINQFAVPTIKEVEMWGKLIFKDINESPLIHSKGMKYYLLHPQDLLEDYRNNVWKTGFMKATFRVNLNYYNIIKICQYIKRSRLIVDKRKW